MANPHQSEINDSAKKPATMSSRHLRSASVTKLCPVEDDTYCLRSGSPIKKRTPQRPTPFVDTSTAAVAQPAERQVPRPSQVNGSSNEIYGDEARLSAVVSLLVLFILPVLYIFYRVATRNIPNFVAAFLPETAPPPPPVVGWLGNLFSK